MLLSSKKAQINSSRIPGSRGSFIRNRPAMPALSGSTSCDGVERSAAQQFTQNYEIIS
jgi:hypothetical protein